MKKTEISETQDKKIEVTTKPFLSKEEYEEIFNIQTNIRELKIRFFDFKRQEKSVFMQMEALKNAEDQLKNNINDIEVEVERQENYSKQRITDIIKNYGMDGDVSIDISEPHYINPAN